jgi:phage terminase large subunit-like protein
MGWGNMNSYIQEYWDGIQSGKCIVGYLVRLQMQKLIEELQDSQIKKNFDLSNKRIQFIEAECRHAQAPFAGKPFHLELFQKAIIEAIYAMQIWNDELKRYVRKYQRVLLVIGRKNGKSPYASAISLSEWVCGEMGTNILFGSNDYEQAGILFDGTNDMREESPKLARCTRKNQKGIFWGNKKRKIKRGKFSSQNKGSIKKISAKTGAKEGKNIKVGVVDEVHEMKDNSLVMPIRQALSTQDEPLYIEITTEGFTDGGYLDSEMEEAHKVLLGEVDDPQWLIFLYQQDSEEEIWQDEQSWYKSNPGLGVIKKWSFLRQMVEEARTNAGTRAFVLAKDFNIKQNSAAAWLDLATVENPATFDIKSLRGMYYIGSLDFAETTDLCNAKAMFINPITQEKKTLTMYFIPETKADAILEEDMNTLNPEKKDYREWAKNGLCTVCQGTEVDASAVAGWFISLYTAYKMKPFKIGYDNWHSQDFKRQIADYFGEDILERIGMDFNSLSNPMNILESDLKYKKINYNNHPIDRWCLMNTAIKTNNIGQIMPIKKYGQSKNRIDGTLGFIIGEATYWRYKTEYNALQEAG